MVLGGNFLTYANYFHSYIYLKTTHALRIKLFVESVSCMFVKIQLNPPN